MIVTLACVKDMVTSMDLKIDPDISGCQRKLTADEFDQLEKNILEDGKILDSIVVWKSENVIIDGENRYLVAKKHKLDFFVEEMEFACKEDAILWVHSHQLGRRNLDGVHAAMVRGKIAMAKGPSGIGEVAETFGISPRQVYRDAELVRAVEDMPDDIKGRLQNGALVASDRAVRAYGSLDSESKKTVDCALRKDPAKALHEVIPERKKPALSEEDQGMVKEYFCPAVRQSIALGGITASRADLLRMSRLDPVVRETIDDVLSSGLHSGEVRDLGAAIDLVNVKPARKSPQVVDVSKLTTKILDMFAAIKRHVDDLAIATGRNYESVQDAIKIAETNVRLETNLE